MTNNPQSIEEHWQTMVLILKKIAEKKNISQYKLAEITGFEQSNINRVFSLKYCPNMRTFIAIARALECNLFIEIRDANSVNNNLFEQAMCELGRRPEKLPKN